MRVRSRSAENFAGAVDDGSVTGSAGAVLAALTAARTDLDVLATPREEFRSALRTRVLAVAAVQPAPVQPAAEPVPSRRTASSRAAAGWAGSPRASRRTAWIGGVLASVLALTGVSVAASRSLPGEPLYGAKRATEALQLRTADNDLERGMRHLQLAETRLREVRALAVGRSSVAVTVTGPPGAVLAGGAHTTALTGALADMDEQTRVGGGLVQGVARAQGDDALLLVLQAWSGQQAERLRAVVPDLPLAARQRAQTSLSVVTDLGTGTGALLAPH